MNKSKYPRRKLEEIAARQAAEGITPPPDDEAQDPPQLETRHYEWMFSAVQGHFVDRIAELELDNVRHQANLDQPLHRKTIQGLGDRQQNIDRNNDYIGQYRLIVDFCMIVRERVMEVSAEEFAKKVAPFLKRKK